MGHENANRIRAAPRTGTSGRVAVASPTGTPDLWMVWGYGDSPPSLSELQRHRTAAGGLNRALREGAALLGVCTVASRKASSMACIIQVCLQCTGSGKKVEELVGTARSYHGLPRGWLVASPILGSVAFRIP